VTPTPGITALLRHARLIALEDLSGQAATSQNLQRASTIIRDTVLRQVLAGLWSEYGVTDVNQMLGLQVEVVIGARLRGESPLKINWDFSRTALALLVVDDQRPERSS